MSEGLELARAAFETWVTNDWKYPETVEKNGEGQYKLMQTYMYWNAWKGCWPLARAAIYSAEQAQIEAPLRAEISRLIAIGVDLRTVLEGAVARCERQAGGYVGCDGQYIKDMRCAVKRAHGIGA